MRSFILSAVAVFSFTASSVLGQIADPKITGQHFGWSEAGVPMTDIGGGKYQYTINGLSPNQRQEFKITSGSWSNTYPSGPNSWYYADANGDITITYDTNSYSDGWSPTNQRLNLSHAPTTWTAAGNFQSQIGGSNWSNSNPSTAMTDIGGGIYQLDAYLSPGSYEWKAVVTGTWDSISSDGRNVSTANWAFTVGADEFARLSVNPLEGSGRVEIVAIPEPASVALLGLGAMALIRRRR